MAPNSLGSCEVRVVAQHRFRRGFCGLVALGSLAVLLVVHSAPLLAQPSPSTSTSSGSSPSTGGQSTTNSTAPSAAASANSATSPAPASSTANDSSRFQTASQGPPFGSTGFHWSMRGAIMLPVGDASKNQTLKGVFGAPLVFGADIGMKPLTHFFLGLNLEAIAGSGGKEVSCDAGCSARGFGVGLLLKVFFRYDEYFDPWVSAGVGYEQLAMHSSSGELFSASGVNLAKLLVGLDYRTKSIAFGPWIGGSLGQYTQLSGPLQDPTMHVWVAAGLGFGANLRSFLLPLQRPICR